MSITSSIGNCFIGIDRLVELPAIEEVLQQFLDFWNSSGSTDQYDVVDGGFVHLGISKCLFNRFQGAAEKIGTKFFKAGPRDAGVKVNAFVQRVDFNRSLSYKHFSISNASAFHNAS
jgi:hypothetical protein